jgi:hypothetical protein
MLFLDEVLMVPSTSIVVAAGGERLMCGGFSLSEPVCLGNFEFIADYFGGLSLSPKRGHNGAIFVGPTRSGALTPHRAMIEDSPEEFLTASSGEGRFSHLSPRWCSTGPCSLPLQPRHGRRTLQPWRCFPCGRRCRSQKPTSPLSDITLTMKDNRCNPMLGIPTPNPDRHHNGATLSMDRPQPRFSRTRLLDMSLCSRQRGS